MPALSGHSQTDKVTVSWADNKFLRCFLASCRAERERERERERESKREPAMHDGSTTTRPDGLYHLA